MRVIDIYITPTIRADVFSNSDGTIKVALSPAVVAKAIEDAITETINLHLPGEIRRLIAGRKEDVRLRVRYGDLSVLLPAVASSPLPEPASPVCAAAASAQPSADPG